MLTVGITIFPAKSGMSFFSNGAHQNCVYLAILLRAAGYRVFLVNGGDGEAPTQQSLPEAVRGIDWVRMPEVVDSLDLLVECGAQVEASDVAKVRARGGKAVTYKFGNALAIDAERAVHDKPAGAIFNKSAFNAVFTTAQHEPTCGAYWELSYRCPVVVLPHIWDPCFLDAMTAAFPSDLRAGYQPGRVKKRVVSLEPNINLIKTAHIPMLCAEAAFRQRPELFDRVLITNAEHLRPRLPFSTFAANLDICKTLADDGSPVCSFESRYNTPWFMSKHGDVVVSHQWIAVPNYSHYDLMHLRYPIVSNVPGMPGYFYPGFDARLGGDALVRAIAGHDAPERLAQYDGECAAFLSSVRATAPANVNAHVKAIEALRGAA